MTNEHTHEAALPETIIDDAAAAAAALREKLFDATTTPGYEAEFDPEEAEHAGAFTEDALNEQDAAESVEDVASPDDEGPVFLEGGASVDVPPIITTTNIREAYGWRPGETLDDAIERQTKGG